MLVTDMELFEYVMVLITIYLLIFLRLGTIVLTTWTLDTGWYDTNEISAAAGKVACSSS